MNTEEKLAFLAGENHALKLAILALLAQSPNLRELLAEFEALSEIGIAVSTPVPVSEPYLEALQQTINELKNQILIQIEAKEPSAPDQAS